MLPKPADWGENLHITGYWFLQESEYQPSVELSRFLEAGPQPVFIGFGSMLDKEAAQTTQIVLESLSITGMRAVLQGGWSEIGAQQLPDNIFRVSEVPHSWLFPRMAAVVHHGGAGTTAAGLRAGVPSVIVPYFADQPFWAQQVHRIGAGPAPVPRLKLDAEKLAAAVQQATQDERINEKARELGDRINQENGVSQAVELINRYLETPEKLMRFNP